MRLERIKVSGFKSFKELDLELRSLNVLIGANGSGKSNFISLFGLLNHMVTPGLGLQLFVGRNGGADSFLHYGRKTTEAILLELWFGKNGYVCEWVPTTDDTLIFSREDAYLKREEPGYDWTWDSLGKGHKETKLLESSRYTKADYVLGAMSEWRVFHFHDTSESSPVKRFGQINDTRYLRSDAGNLAAFLLQLRRNKPGEYQAIRGTVQLVTPFFDDFVLRPSPENENVTRLEWRERNSDFPFLAHHLSDGTLRFICLATALLQPNPPSAILIDEPELGLHPFALSVLASLIRKASHKTQVIISTQSVPLVNEFAPDDLLVVNRRNGASVIERPEPAQLEGWLEDYSLGELWEKNVIGGRPSR